MRPHFKPVAIVDDRRRELRPVARVAAARGAGAHRPAVTRAKAEPPAGAAPPMAAAEPQPDAAGLVSLPRVDAGRRGRPRLKSTSSTRTRCPSATCTTAAGPARMDRRCDPAGARRSIEQAVLARGGYPAAGSMSAAWRSSNRSRSGGSRRSGRNSASGIGRNPVRSSVSAAPVRPGANASDAACSARQSGESSREPALADGAHPADPARRHVALYQFFSAARSGSA